MIDFEALKNETKGKWASIYYHLGVKKRLTYNGFGDKVIVQ